MALQTMTPMPWRKVVLLVAPGIFFGLSRYDLFGWLAMISFALVAILAVVKLATQKRLPAWGLLAFGLLTYEILLGAIFLTSDALSSYSYLLIVYGIRPTYALGQFLISIPLWILIITLVWKYSHIWRSYSWALLLIALAVLSASTFWDASIFKEAGLMLLPIALVLPLSKRYGSLAPLFVLGAFHRLLLSDSDYYSGPLMDDRAFYPVYVILLHWFLIGLAPLLLVRARSQGVRAFGLLVPAGIMLLARVAVPWLVLGSEVHPLRIWLGDTFLSVFVLMFLALAFVLSSKSSGEDNLGTTADNSQPVFAG